MADEEAEYHCKDFEWEEVQAEVENDSSLQYHLAPFSPSPSSLSSSSSSSSSEPWRSFHRRHSTGKFFKVSLSLSPPPSLFFKSSSHFGSIFFGSLQERRYLLKEFPEFVACGDSTKVLEVGCGNGSTVLPILR